MKILMHFVDWNYTPERKRLNTYGAIGYYRIVKVAEQIKGHEVKIIGKELLHFGKNMVEQWDNIFKDYDVFWTNYFSGDKNQAMMIYHAQKHGKKIVIDLDDNYFDVPKTNLLYDRFKEGKSERAFMSTMLSFVDCITVSTEPLKEKVKEHIKKVHNIDKPVFVIANHNDKKDWNFSIAPKEKAKIVIGYAGSNSHKDDLIMVMPAIAEIMKKYKNVYFDLIGAIAKNDIKDYFKGSGMTDECLMRINLKPATSTFKEFPQYLCEQGWDIGICPLVDTDFTRSKSHIKWMEYAMAGITTVASKVYPYCMDVGDKKTIVDGETGFLCANDQWFDVLEKLVLDKDLRESVTKNAKEYVEEVWQYDNSDISRVVEDMLKNG